MPIHCVLLVLLLFSPEEVRAEEAASGLRVEVPRLLSGGSFLYRSGRPYSNYAFEDYSHPETVLNAPRQNFYGPLGNFLIKGYDVYSWRETRASQHTGDRVGSAILKQGGYEQFDRTVVASESHRGWAARLIIADEIRSAFTPLTLLQSRLNGMRLDARTRNTRSSFLASRWSDPVFRDSDTGGHAGQEVRNSSLLTGGHGGVQLGALMVGMTGVNFHLFDSQQDGFDLRGGLRSGQSLPGWLVVRFADDSPEDDQGGAVISAVRLSLNGQPRPDLQPVFVRINVRNPTAVGRTSRLTGKFTPTSYPDGGTRFGDFFYLQEHLRGEDVSGSVNLELLLRFVQVLPGGSELRADGEDQILAYFDLSEEPYVGQVRVEALVGNDYRADVVGLHVSNNRARDFESRFQARNL